MAEPIWPIVQRTGEFVEVVLTGEIDLVVEADLLDAYERAMGLVEVPHLLIDLSGVTFMDSTGLGTLGTALTRATACGGTLAVVHASPRIQRLLEITQLDRVIPVLSEAPKRAPGPPVPQSSSTA